MTDPKLSDTRVLYMTCHESVVLKLTKLKTLLFDIYGDKMDVALPCKNSFNELKNALKIFG